MPRKTAVLAYPAGDLYPAPVPRALPLLRHGPGILDADNLPAAVTEGGPASALLPRVHAAVANEKPAAAFRENDLVRGVPRTAPFAGHVIQGYRPGRVVAGLPAR